MLRLLLISETFGSKLLLLPLKPLHPEVAAANELVCCSGEPACSSISNSVSCCCDAAAGAGARLLHTAANTAPANTEAAIKAAANAAAANAAAATPVDTPE